MILQFDIGNSFHKWRCLDLDDRVIVEDRFANDDAGAWRQIEQLIVNSGVTEVQIASVSQLQYQQRIEQLCQQFSIASWCAEVTPEACGVRCAYGDPRKLGVDRWLALIAAHSIHPGVIVIDAGSALTIDVVDSRGTHHGGIIAPGLPLLQSSLKTGTAGVRWDHMTNMVSAVGQSTADCVAAGIKNALLGCVAMSCQKIRSEFAENMPVLVCGGDADLIINAKIIAECRLMPSLVLDGLSLLAKQLRP